MPAIAKLRNFGWPVAALLLAIYAAMLHRYSVDFPHADDFSQIVAVPYYVGHARTLQEQLAHIFSLAVEHRIATLRLAALLQAHILGGLDFRMLQYFGNLVLLISGLLLISTFDRAVRPLAAVVAAALLLSPAGYEGMFWTTGALQHLGGVGYAFAALYCLSRPGLGWQLGAALLALAAAFTSAGGLMEFPAAIVLLGLQARWRAAVVWAICGAALFAVYFIGYEAPPYQGSLQTYLRDPLILVRFFLIALGAFGRSPWIAVALGVTLCLVWIGLAGSGRLKSVPPVLAAWMVFLVLSFAAITWGRAGFGDAGASLSRYRVYAEFAVLVTLAALVSQVSTAAAMRVLGVAVPVALITFLASWRYDLPAMERFSIDRRNELDYYAAEGHNLPTPMPPVGFRDFLLAAGRDGGYYNPTRATPPRHLRAEPIALDTTDPPRVFVEPPMVGKRVALIKVYAPGYDDDAFVWLKSGDRQYRGTLDRMPRAPLALGYRTGFLWGLFALDGVAPGTYRVGIMAGDRSSPSVAWSDKWITVE